MDKSLIDKISKVIKKPYVSDLLSLAVPQKYWDAIFKKIYGDVTTTEIETDYADGIVTPNQYFFCFKFSCLGYLLFFSGISC